MEILIDIRLLGRDRTSGVPYYTYNIVNQIIKIADPKFHFQLFYNGLKKYPLPQNWLSAKNVSVINWHWPNKIFGILKPPVDKLVKTDLIYSPHIDFLNHHQTPRILTIHDLSFIHYKHFFSYKQRLWHYLQNIKKQTAKADRVIANSEYTKKDIMETLIVPENKISVIYPGVNNPNTKAEATGSRSKRIVPTSAGGFILYLGTLEPRKNITAIIKSFNVIKSTGKYPELKLVLAGRPGWLYKEITKEIKQSLFKQEIILRGIITDAEKNMLYNSARAFIYPSFFEGFGFPPIEAQIHNCPVITSNRSSLPEIMRDSALQINPWKTGELAEAIDQVLCGQKLKTKLVEAGQENIKRFNWEKCAVQLLKLFSGYL